MVPHAGVIYRSGVKQPLGPQKARTTLKAKDSGTFSDPIEFIESSDMSDSIKEEPADMSLIRGQIHETQKVASQLRLTKKQPAFSASAIPAVTKGYLAKKAAQTSEKPLVFTFRVTVFLQRKHGQNVGTCVPFQTKTFQASDVSTSFFCILCQTHYD